MSSVVNKTIVNKFTAVNFKVLIIWTRVCAYACTSLHLNKAKEEVTVTQLKNLLSNIDRLGLALHGVTPALENGRRTHFQMLGEAVPALVVPAANVALYAEFTRLTQFLNGFGFPVVESVRLHPMDFSSLRPGDTIWRSVSCNRKNASNTSSLRQPHRCHWLVRFSSSSGIPILRQFTMRAISGFMEP